MTAKEIVDIKVKVMSMAIEIYRLNNHAAFGVSSQQVGISSKSVTAIYKELVNELELSEYI